jgi:Transposase DDE domain
MVERSIAWLIGPKSRCRQLRYRGVSKNNQWLHLRMAGLNLRRMINLCLQPAAGGWIIPDPASTTAPAAAEG